jgi:hypothetical protein
MDDVKSNEQILDDTHITVENEMSTIKTENNVSSNDSTENSANIVKKEANEISMEIDEGNVKTENIDEEKKETSKDVADYNCTIFTTINYSYVCITTCCYYLWY